MNIVTKIEKELIKAKRKMDVNFLEEFYNKNFRLETKSLRMIDAAYKYKDILGLKITRRDYSNIHIISEL